MIVGVCTIDLHIAESGSLKSKRHVLRSIKDRLKGRFNISVAEVEDQDLWQRVTLGVACIGTDNAQVNRVLDHVIDFVEEIPDVEVIEATIEII